MLIKMWNKHDSRTSTAQSAETVEYADCISAEE